MEHPNQQPSFKWVLTECAVLCNNVTNTFPPQKAVSLNVRVFLFDSFGSPWSLRPCHRVAVVPGKGPIGPFLITIEAENR